MSALSLLYKVFLRNHAMQNDVIVAIHVVSYKVFLQMSGFFDWDQDDELVG